MTNRDYACAPYSFELAVLEQKMWFCLFSGWEGMECAWSCASETLEEVRPQFAA